MSGTARLERLGIPVVLAVARGFEKDADAACLINQVPAIRQVIIDGYVWGRQVREAKRELAVKAFDELIAASLRPLNTEETEPDISKAEEAPYVEVTGEGYESACESFNDLYLASRWGDGLPLVPPTEERVAWMLSGTSRNPDEVIGTVAPGNGIATIKKIAINAVMAGAKPEYLPVIITAMEGLTDPDFDLLHPQASTGNFSFSIIVTGPIAGEIGMHGGIGYLGHGWRANNTIGRAVRLCLINLGHVWPGVADMANVGRPSSHTFYTYTENYELSPWDPYHAGRGFNKDDSCVTVSTVGGYGGFGVGHLLGNSGQELISAMVRGISQNRSIFSAFRHGTANPAAHWSKHLITLYPMAAQQLQDLGFNQQTLAQYIYERASVPYEELAPAEIKQMQSRIDASIARDMLYADTIPPDRMEVFRAGLKPGGKLPVLIDPSDIHFFVAGPGAGVPGSAVWFSYIKAVYQWTSHQTRPVRDATLTTAGK